MLGLFVAVVLGSLMAMLMDAFPLLGKLLHPLLVASQSVPMLVLAPLFIIYLGFGLTPKIVTVALMCFFPVAISFADGLADVDKRKVDLVRQMGAGTLQIYRLVKIPAALTALFSGLHVAASYSVLGAVVGEWLGGEKGLGFYMLRVKNAYMLDRVFAVILVIITLSILLNQFFRWFKWVITPWER
jgi:ABC-type nitrate/sulfonate/bicarbonate transport system permease component